MAANTTASSLCTACDKHNARFCGRCKGARYCSAECQKADWPTHKLLCKSFSSFDVSSRKTSEFFRAIFFPVDENPKVVWMQSKWVDDDEGRYQHPQTASFLGEGAFPRHIPIQYNNVLKRKLLDTIYICHRDAFLIDGSGPNQAVAAITSTKPGQYHDWRGPIIAYGKRGLGIDPDKCRDIDTDDYRHVVDYFLSYDFKPVPAVTRQPAPARVKAVRINCLGDQKLYNKPQFEAIEIPWTHSIFSSHATSDIANRIEFPIFTQRCPPDPKWTDPRNGKKLGIHDPLINQDATFLHLCCDPKADFDPSTGSLGWGWAPRQWQQDVGSILVARQDKKALFPLHAEALCKYCRHEARAFLAHSIGEYSPEEPIAVDTALSMISRAAFVISWYKLLDQKQDKEDLETPYPYEV